MKKILFGLLMALSFLAAPVRAQTNATRIATIDMLKVSDKYYKWQRAKKALSNEQAALQKDLDDIKNSIDKDTEDYKKLRNMVDDPMITADERHARETQAQEKQNAIGTDQASYKELLNQGQQKLELDLQNLTQKVMEDIQAAVKAKARDRGFSLVLNTASDNLQPNATVLYSSGDNDITEEIIRELNAGAPIDSANGSTNAAPATK
jgi:Skp family chaperone for outer membrane proteins